MTNKDTKKPSKVSRPGMMGDGTEEQGFDQTGDPKARITQDEVEEAFGKKPGAPSKEDQKLP